MIQPEEKKETTAIGSNQALASGPQAAGGWADWALSTVSSKIAGMNMEPTRSEPGAVTRQEQNREEPAKVHQSVVRPSPNSGSSSTFTPSASMSHSVLQPTKTSSNPEVVRAATNGMASKPMKLASPAFPAYVNNVVKPDWDADGWGNDLIDFVRFIKSYWRKINLWN